MALVKKLNLEENVLFYDSNKTSLAKGFDSPKVAVMQKAWANILVSVKEGWGMVVTEAAACGTLSIVSGVSGLKDAVENNKTGIVLAKNPSAKQISDAMEKIITDTNLRQKLSKEAYKFSLKFDWDIFYRGMKQIL